MQEFVTVKNSYNTGENRTPQIVSRTGIDWSTPIYSGSRISYVAICTSPTPPSICIFNGIIGNIWQTNTPNFREISELHTSIDRILTNDSIAPSAVIQIIRD